VPYGHQTAIMPLTAPIHLSAKDRGSVSLLAKYTSPFTIFGNVQTDGCMTKSFYLALLIFSLLFHYTFFQACKET
jgi:hypothetical protein